jgi:hypothetical protein
MALKVSNKNRKEKPTVEKITGEDGAFCIAGISIGLFSVIAIGLVFAVLMLV